MAYNKNKMSELDLALCRSAFYETLALGFAPPTDETIARLISGDQNQALAQIAMAFEEYDDSENPPLLSQVVCRLKGGSEGNTLSALDEVFRFLFGHTARAKVPPYETEYGEETLFQQPHQLGDIAGFYKAFGLRLNPGEHERVDHISCECEFMAFLTRKEAYALDSADSDMLRETRRAQKLFLKDHLGRFAPSFSNLLLREDAGQFYGTLAMLCQAFILRECRRQGVSAGPEKLRLRPAVMEEGCFSCGCGDEIIRNISGPR